MAGTYFNMRQKLGILDKDQDSSDIISVFTTEHVTCFTVWHFANLWNNYFD